MSSNGVLSGVIAAAVLCLAGAASAQVSNGQNGTILAPPARGAASGTPGVPADKQPPDLSGGSSSNRPIVVMPGSSRGGAAEPAEPSAAAAAAPSPAPASGETVEERFRDWTMQCVGKGAGRPCQIIYTMSSGSAAQVVLVISMAYVAGSDQLAMQMALPLGLSIARGATFEIGESFRATLPISRCTSQGCLVEGPVAGQLVEAMRRAPSGRISVAPPVGEPVALPVSLAGFSAALDRLKTESPVATIGQPAN